MAELCHVEHLREKAQEITFKADAVFAAKCRRLRDNTRCSHDLFSFRIGGLPGLEVSRLPDD